MPKTKRQKDDYEFCHHCYNCNKNWGKSCGGGVYFVGFIGAAVYYIQNSVGFWNGVLGILKAAVWPAFVVHKLLGM